MKTMIRNNDKNQKHEKRIGWRILVGFCAVAIALLLTIDIEPVHAADVNVSVKTKAGSKTITTKKTVSSLPDADITFTVGEEEKHGFLLQTLFEEAVGASEIYDSIGNGYQGDYVLVPDDMKVYAVDGTGQGTSKGSGSSITYTMSDDYCPVASATISSGGFSLEVGKSKQLSASYTGDAFFESDYSKYVEWNSSNSDIATVDNTGKVIVNKAGNATISIKEKGGESLSTVSVTGTAKPTMPPTTAPPTTMPPTTQKPTKRSIEPSTYSPTATDGVLIASVIAKGKKKLQFTWTKVPGASGYDIFLAKCKDGEYKCICKKVKTIKGNGKCKWKKSGLDKKTAYHGYVKAFVMMNGKKQYIRTSPVVHAFTSGSTENYTNAKSVKVKKSKVTLTKGKTFKIKASVKKLKKSKKLMSKKHAPKLRYMSSNSGVAVACTCGKVTAVGKGTCYIYAFAHNGKYKRIKVTVR